jgi:hypothetical protein
MVALLQRMLAPQHAERLRGAMIAAKNGAPPCTCGNCEICLWQYLLSPGDELLQSAEKAIGENLNYRETLRQLHAFGMDSLTRHEISLTRTQDGVTSPLLKPELDHIIRGLDGYIAYAKGRVKDATTAEADAKAAVRGYHETAKRAIDERDGLEKTARGLSSQYETCFALAVEALHVSDPGALSKDTKLTTLLGRLASQRDTALSREIAMRLFIEGHADYMTGDDVEKLSVDYRTRAGATVTIQGVELRNLVLSVVAKVSEAWALPGSPSTRMIRDSRASSANAKQLADLSEWLKPFATLTTLPLPTVDAVKALVQFLASRGGFRARIEARRLLGESVEPELPTLGALPPDVTATVRTRLAHLQTQAMAQVKEGDDEKEVRE